VKEMSNEATAEVFKIQPATLKRWLAIAAKQCDKVNATLMKDLNVQRIQIDDMWVIVKKIVPRMEAYEDYGPWMRIAFAPDSRLIVAFIIGPRKPKIVPIRI
jgi:hypothetical protein